MGQFSWLGDGTGPDAQWDLRRLGWRLRDQLDGHHPLLSDGSRLPAAHLRGRTIAVGIEHTDQRAKLISAGVADAIGIEISLHELAIRVSRTAINSARMPRRWRVGPLVLDLMHRDAQVGDRWLALRPREFGLLWRLAEAQGQRVTRHELLRDVWRLQHDPGTNSVEVHVSRLRANLAQFGLSAMLQTDENGGYSLRVKGGALFGGNAFLDRGRYVMAQG